MASCLEKGKELNALKYFDVNILSLSDKIHEFTFVVDNSFFECFEDSSIKQGDLKVLVKMDKGARMIQCDIAIIGKINLTCDRSLEEFKEEINLEEFLVFKYGESHEELSDEIIMIPHDCDVINFAQYIYEFIMVSLPMKILHPKFRSHFEDEDEDENDILVYTSAQDGADEDEEEDQVIDPRWEKLKQLENRLNKDNNGTS